MGFSPDFCLNKGGIFKISLIPSVFHAQNQSLEHNFDPVTMFFPTAHSH